MLGRGAAHISPRHLWPQPPYDGDESYDVFVADGFVAGVIEGSAVLVARPDFGDLLVVREAPGPHPDVWCAEGDAETLFGALLSHVPGRVHAPVPTGWCSWYCYWEHVDESACEQMLRRLQPHADTFDVFLVDDGYQHAIGDWLDTNDRFPSGLCALADRIATAGYRPGLWVAPFVVGSMSKLAQQRPQWVLRDGHGAPVVAAHVDHWRAPTYAIDVSRADVRAWLEELAHTLATMGFEYLKIDFGYAPALDGVHAHPLTAEQRTRAALQALRDGAGEDAYLTASGTPLWPAIGIVDAMRVGPDVAPCFDPDPLEGIAPAHVASLSSAWRAAVLREPMHGRCWTNDPDCVMLRRRNTRLTAAQRERWSEWVARSGQVMMLADRAEDLDDGDLDRWAALVEGHRANC